MTENRMRDQIFQLGCSLFDRGLIFGSTGNISVRMDFGWEPVPTGSCLEQLDPGRVAKLSIAVQAADDAPTKEAFLHTERFDCRPNAFAIVHSLSTHSVAASGLHGAIPANVLPPLTA